MTAAVQELLAQVAGDLKAIEEVLVSNLTPRYELVAQVAGHILFSGGKRLRPLLMVLGGRLCGYEKPDLQTFAVIFEYLHVATLLHDDVVDGARVRRHQPVAHQVWSPEIAVLTGDFLLARALRLAASTEKMAVIRVIADITENMAQGEIEQLHRKGDLTLSEPEYRTIIERKTALLFRGACRISGLIAEASGDQLTALSDYGYHLGMAFQMVDDLLDYLLDAAAWGKQVGTDLKEGKLTLPVIHALAASGGPQSPLYRTIAALIQQPEVTPEVFEDLVMRLQQSGSLDYTRQQAAAHVEKARNALLTFEPSSTRDILFKVADYALQRKK